MVRDRQKAQVTREKTRVTFSTGKRTQHCAMHRLLIFGVGAYFFFNNNRVDDVARCTKTDEKFSCGGWCMMMMNTKILLATF